MSRARLLLHGVLTGVLFGVLGGCADAWTTSHTFLDRSFLGLSTLAWLICWLAGGAALGIVAAALTDPAAGRGWRSGASLAATVTAIGAVATAWFLVVVYVNVVHLASDTGRAALLFDAASVVAAVLLAIALARALRGAFARPSHLLRGLLASVAGPPALAAGAIALAALLWRGGVGDVAAPSTAAPAAAPNVVLVLVDTLRRDHLSGEGYERDTTPALDELARRGVRFPRFASQSCYTKPAVASLLTSLHPSGHGVGHLRTVLPESRRTLAETFHDAGWRTAKFVSNTIIGPEFGFAQGTELFHTLPTELVPRTKLGYALFRLTERGREIPGFAQLAALLRGMEQRLTGRRGSDVLGLYAPEVLQAFGTWRASLGDDPFFAYLHFMEPHAPYRPPADVADRFPGDELVDEHPPTVGLFLPYQQAPPVPAERRRGMIRAYDAEIAALDEKLGGFLTQLLEAGDGRPTIVAVTSDHGEEFYEHGGWGHGQSLHEEQLQVPFVLAGAGVPAGVEVDAPAQLIDVAPTLLDLAGVPAPEAMQGRSLVPWFRAGPEAIAAAADREHFAEIVYGDAYWARSLRTGRWKTILSRLGEDVRVQLFDLEADPGETRDLATELADRAGGMVARIEQLAAAAAANAGPGATAEFDPVTQERLRALGYVE